MSTQDELILQASAAHPHPQPAKVFQYGTAGFRMNADLLDSVVFRSGLLAALRSRKLNGQTIGVMITASHNPPKDNGVKLVDPMGEMLEASWETYATELACATSHQEMLTIYNKLATDLKVKTDTPARVYFARDTRPSGPALRDALQHALTATGTDFKDFGFLTTPQLHYVVRCINTQGTPAHYGDPTEDGYYRKISAAFKAAMKHRKPAGGVILDCANGVGAPKLQKLIKYLPRVDEGGVDIKVVNDDISKPEMLNVQCGADYVKTGQRAPPSSQAQPGMRCASLDGDADRLVYYYLNQDKQFCLLDGDRIATLAASFLGELGRQAGLADSLRVGVVQTAYANGASTDYIEKTLKLPVVCTATGVKHLHHAAMRFDIGVYFEANGHGTVLFSPAAQRAIQKHEPQSPAQQTALETLAALNDLINQAVGDALSDMLLVEVILAHKKWTVAEWTNTYKDLPNRLVAVDVEDRNIFKTTDAERKLEKPEGVQKSIDEAVSKYKSGRSFARASGTEDKVRVYAEASTKSEAEDLANKIVQIIQKAH